MKKRVYFIVCVFCLVTSCKKRVQPQIADIWQDYRKAYGFLNKNVDSAFYYFNKVVNTAKDKKQVAMAYTSMAMLQVDAGDYFGCQESLTSSLRLLDADDHMDSAALSTNYNELGLASYNLKNYDEAIDFYRKALQLSVDSSNVPVITNNLANAYQSKKEYDYAVQLYSKVLGVHTQSKENYARLLTNMVVTKWLRDTAYNAAPGLLKALHLRQQIKDDWGQNSSYASLTDYYTRLRPDSALYYAAKWYAAAIKLHSADDQLEALEKLIRLSPANRSKGYFIRYHMLNDSVQTARNAAKNQFALIRYNAEKNKADNLKLQKDNTENKYQIAKQQFLLGGAILIFVLAGAGGLLWYQKREQRLKLEAANTIREHQLKTSKKVHDVVANGLYRMMAEVQHQQEMDKEQLLDRIEVLYERSRDISYEPSRQYTRPEQRLGALLASFGNAGTRVAIIGNEEALWQNIKEETIYELEQVMLELMVNMKKHSRASIVTVRFQKLQQKMEINYHDNGRGFPEKINFGNGLSSTGNRIKAIGGTINFEGRQGAHITIRFPAA